MKKRLILLLVLCTAASTVKIINRKAIVRKGPGIFFEKIKTLDIGEKVSVVSQQEQWIEIAKQEYIPKKSFFKQKKYNDVFQKMGASTTDIQATKHGLSAGIKGFAANFIQNPSSYENFISEFHKYEIDKSLYKEVKRSRKKRKRNIKKARKYIPLNNDLRDSFSNAERHTGLAFAASIASGGLYRNKKVESYLNVFGNTLIEATQMYDQQFYFFILDTDKVNAYACPGGIIFITKGLLKIVKNDAELAFILCHEFAHSILQHGFQEIAKRKNIISAESAFAELETELDNMGFEQDEEMLAVEQELEKELFDFFNIVSAGRLQQYEYEADNVGLKYLLRNGYTAAPSLDILKRLNRLQTESTNEHYTNEQIIDRIENLRKTISNMNFKPKQSIQFNNWEKYQSLL